MTRKYEGMFLFDPAAAPDWEACRAELDRLMDRIGAKVIVASKWDERRLAYEIRGRKRGIYGLTFFEADPNKLIELERDTNLSEAVLRVLILKAEHLTEEEMKEVVSRPVSTSSDNGEPSEPTSDSSEKRVRPARSRADKVEASDKDSSGDTEVPEDSNDDTDRED